MSELEQAANLDDELIDGHEDSAPSQETNSELGEQPAEEQESPEQGGDFIPENDLTPEAKTRINRLTAEKYSALRENEDLKRRLAEATAKDDQEILNRPAPTEEEHDFDSEAHQQALKEHFTAQGEARGRQAQREEFAQQQAVAEQVKAVGTYNERAADFKANTPDFEQSVASLAGMEGGAMMEIIKDEEGPQIAYWLSKNMEVAQQLHTSPPVQQGRILAEIKHKLAAAPKANTMTGAGKPNENPQPGGGVPPKGDEFDQKFPDAEII